MWTVVSKWGMKDNDYKAIITQLLAGYSSQNIQLRRQITLIMYERIICCIVMKMSVYASVDYDGCRSE